MTDINITTAQHYIRKYNDEEEKCLTVDGSKKFLAGRTGKLTDEYSNFLVEALYRHLVQRCRVTYIENAREVARHKKFWQSCESEKGESRRMKATPNLNFCRNCVHQRSRFNLHKQRNYGRYLKGSQQKAVIPIVRGVSIINLGVISQAESWTYHWRNLRSYNYKEEEGKWEGSSCGERSNRIQTEQYLAYLWNLIGVLDRKNMNSHYPVTDMRRSILQQRYVILLKNRGYKCIYLSPYSPFLNPIEEFMVQSKGLVRWFTLNANDRLTDRICESVQKVTGPDCQAWFGHAVSFLPRCKLEGRNLWTTIVGCLSHTPDGNYHNAKRKAFLSRVC